MGPLAEILAGVRFLRRLPDFLRYRIDVPEARAVLRRRLDDRAADFLSLVRVAVYARPESLYRRVLGVAGCEYGDLERLVRQDGLESTLAALLRHGVYLTNDELKGRRAVVRSGTSIEARPNGLENPLVRSDLFRYRSGSRAPRRRCPSGSRPFASGASTSASPTTPGAPSAGGTPTGKSPAARP